MTDWSACESAANRMLGLKRSDELLDPTSKSSNQYRFIEIPVENIHLKANISSEELETKYETNSIANFASRKAAVRKYFKTEKGLAATRKAAEKYNKKVSKRRRLMKRINITIKNKVFKAYCTEHCISASKLVSKLVDEWLLEQTNCKIKPETTHCEAK